MEKYKVNRLLLEVTRLCNLDCKHCFRGEAENVFMGYETITNILKNISEINHLTLSGGEPLLALNQLNAIAEYIKRNDIMVNDITIVTNATVLNADVIRVLEKLQMVCRDLHIRVSDDKFHRMALERKGLVNRRLVNFELLHKLFGATLYGTPRKDRVPSIIESVGRATKLTNEDMEEVNSYGDYRTYYVLSKSAFWEGVDMTVQYDIPKYIGHHEIEGLLNVNAHGYLTDSYASYKDADSHNIEECNLNNVGLLEAIQNNSLRVYALKNQKEKTL